MSSWLEYIFSPCHPLPILSEQADSKVFSQHLPGLVMPDLLPVALFEENHPASFMRKYHRAAVELRCGMQTDVLGSDQFWGWEVIVEVAWDGLTVWVDPLLGRVLVSVLVLTITPATILTRQRCQRCHLQCFILKECQQKTRKCIIILLDIWPCRQLGGLVDGGGRGFQFYRTLSARSGLHAP